MKAVVRNIDLQSGLCVAEIDGMAEYVILELLDSSEPEIGDTISHPNFYALGGETYRNITQQLDFEVFVQDVRSESMGSDTIEIKQ